MTRYIAETDFYSFEIWAPEDTDFDSAFDAIDAETGETLRIYGWLWNFDHAEEAAAA